MVRCNLILNLNYDARQKAGHVMVDRMDLMLIFVADYKKNRKPAALNDRSVACFKEKDMEKLT